MTNWYFHDPAQGRVGPIDADAVREHFRAGRVHRDTLLWREGLSEWQPLERVAAELELEQALRPAVPEPPPLPTSAFAANASAASSAGSTDTGAASASTSGSSAPGSSASAASPAPAAGSASAGRPDADARSVAPGDYAPAHVERRQPAAAPARKSGPSGCLIALIIGAVVVVVVGGILAAIALPAYQDYTVRAKIAGALAASSAHKLQVAEYYAEHQACPSNESQGFQPAASYAGTNIASIEFGRFKDTGHCGIQVTLRGIGTGADGAKLWQSFDPAANNWRCSSDLPKQAQLPQNCR